MYTSVPPSLKLKLISQTREARRFGGAVGTRQDKARQDKTKQDKTRQSKTRQDKTKQDKARQDKSTRQENKMRQELCRKGIHEGLERMFFCSRLFWFEHL